MMSRFHFASYRRQEDDGEAARKRSSTVARSVNCDPNSLKVAKLASKEVLKVVID
jgi:hypothetical protein